MEDSRMKNVALLHDGTWEQSITLETLWDDLQPEEKSEACVTDEITDSASKSAIGIQKCHKSNYADSDGRTSDIYINDGISHQTDSNQLNHILKSNRIFNYSQFI